MAVENNGHNDFYLFSHAHLYIWKVKTFQGTVYLKGLYI